jgi:hypothetical protein
VRCGAIHTGGKLQLGAALGKILRPPSGGNGLNCGAPKLDDYAEGPSPRSPRLRLKKDLFMSEPERKPGEAVAVIDSIDVQGAACRPQLDEPPDADPSYEVDLLIGYRFMCGDVAIQESSWQGRERSKLGYARAVARALRSVQFVVSEQLIDAYGCE